VQAAACAGGTAGQGDSGTGPAAASTHVTLELDNLAIGIDGLLHLAAAAGAAGNKNSKSSSSSRTDSTGAKHAASASSAQGNEQQRAVADPAGKPAVSLEVQLSQCQLLSCRGSSGSNTTTATGSAPAPADSRTMHWQTAGSLPPAWQALQSDPGGRSQAVSCELLLNLPMVCFSLQPIHHHQQQKLSPRLLLQDIAVYLPSVQQLDVLLPVLHVPRVLLSGAQQQQQQEQQQPGLAAVLEQQAECHRLIVPAVASSWRPSQLQHLMHCIGRLEQQWQGWVAAAKCGQDKQTALGRQQQQQQQQQRETQAQQHQQQPPLSPPPLQHRQQQAQGQQRSGDQQAARQLTVDINSIQLLLLPADGTSDKGMLLHWQDLQAVLLSNPPQSQQQQQPHDARMASACAAAGTKLLQRTQVSWQELAVSAIQQQDAHSHEHSEQAVAEPQHGADSDGVQHVLAPDGPEAPLPPPSTAEPFQQAQQALIFAQELPAVAWLSQGAVSRVKQQQPAGHRPADASGQAVAPAPLSSHATLSRFLSAQESWRDVPSNSGSVDGTQGFFTPVGSGSLRSATSWATARSSSLSAALSIQSQQQQRLQQQVQPQGPPGSLQLHRAPAAGAAMGGAGSNIIAAWWQAEPPGQSPPGASPCNTMNPGLLGWPSIRQNAAANTEEQRWGFLQNTTSREGGQLSGLSPPNRPPGSTRTHVRRSSSFKRGLQTTSSLFDRGSGVQQRAASIASRPSLVQGAPSADGAGSCAAPSTHGHVHDDGLTDADVEFYSIAGDSEDAYDDGERLSAFGSPRSQHAAADEPGLKGVDDTNAEDEAWLRCWHLLPLAGFGGQGCAAAASWLLLSLSAGAPASAADGVHSPAGQAGLVQQQPALQLEVRQEFAPNTSVAGAAAVAAAIAESQVTSVFASQLQLQLSSKHWDLVAACILQAVNAAKRPAGAPTRKLASPQQPVQQQQQRPPPLLHVGLQELQVVLFVPPDAAEAPSQGQTLHMRRSSGHSSRCGAQLACNTGQQQTARQKSPGFGPWQDPGSEPTTPTFGAAAAAAGWSAAQTSEPSMAAGASGSHRALCAAQTVVLTLSIEADIALSAGGTAGGLQQLRVPALSLQLGAEPWDMAAGRPDARCSNGVDAQQERLLLLLVQGIRLSAGSSTSSLPGGVNMPAGAVPNTKQLGRHLQVGVSSVSGWVSTTRASLLLNLQQHLMQQLPAITAAAAMAGPSSFPGPLQAAAAAAVVQGSSGLEQPAGANLVGAPSLVGGKQQLSGNSSSMRRGSLEQTSTGAQLVLDSSVDVAVQKVAVLVSTDEPEPWLLLQLTQRPQHVLASPAGSRVSSPQQLSSQATLHGAAASLLLATRPLAAAAASLGTCSTPLLEVALLPVSIRLAVLKPLAARPGLAGQQVLQVDVDARVRADVYNVEKLGWEPVLDPWSFKVSGTYQFHDRKTAWS